MRFDTVEYLVGESLPDLGLWIVANDDLLDLTSGYTFNLSASVDRGGAPVFTTTSGFVGGAGAGQKGNGTPNLTKVWSQATELVSLEPDTTYWLRIAVTRTSDSRLLLGLLKLNMVGN